MCRVTTYVNIVSSVPAQVKFRSSAVKQESYLCKTTVLDKTDVGFRIMTDCVLPVQDAQGNDLCQYREFDPSEQGDTDEDEEQWHSQKKGCCAIM